ncbi:MAG: tRNA preQ1(34) S-adenosylmethionine ribosyltransferase-isomerase QueA [Proteobacteria bacterium]|nr:MAG: tRNA preQ1(34) S-adenosylmethionine ribosyltransferase-isomerase QueA [Pseudomonadota bacterium]PIE18483.1 MAG: tRNA preQ1(34) S-adenosylmethionine ribosyltransferase-isomerase QueA [Pseudomonadota bacterium]
MTLADFDYDLPPDQIAQRPPARRDGGRLMVLRRDSKEVTHASIGELPGLLPADALVVINDSKVLPARLRAKRATGGRVEFLLLERISVGRWTCMFRASKGLRSGEILQLLTPDPKDSAEAPSTARVKVCNAPYEGRCQISLDEDWIYRLGAIPLPPYIQRPADDRDVERYQTVYAAEEGSVAAPTAGLHLTNGLLSALEERGIELTRVTLHVGPGTFVPVRQDDPDEHRMDEERYEVSQRSAAAIARARSAGRPIIAVGTTVVRTLEASAGLAAARRTDLFIRPGYEFNVVSGLMTNFHLPRSTLLMLVCAFRGRERVLAAYREAVVAGYRFYSYGDAMLLL